MCTPARCCACLCGGGEPRAGLCLPLHASRTLHLTSSVPPPPPHTPAGLILQFDYFLNNGFGVLLMLFWLFAMAMTSFSYFFSCFVKKVGTRQRPRGVGFRV